MEFQSNKLIYQKEYSNDLWLYIHYYEDELAEKMLEIYRPIRASDDNF